MRTVLVGTFIGSLHSPHPRGMLPPVLSLPCFRGRQISFKDELPITFAHSFGQKSMGGYGGGYGGDLGPSRRAWFVFSPAWYFLLLWARNTCG